MKNREHLPRSWHCSGLIRFTCTAILPMAKLMAGAFLLAILFADNLAQQTAEEANGAAGFSAILEMLVHGPVEIQT